MTNSFNDLVGLPLPTETELVEPVEQPDEDQAIASAAMVPEPELLRWALWLRLLRMKR